MKLSRNQPLKILHIASGDLWAGAEVQLYTLLTALQKLGGTSLHVALMNEGELTKRLRERGIPVTVFDEASLSALQILSGLRRLMLELTPDIIHTHRIKENILGSFANLLATRAASIRTIHGAQEHPPRGLRQIHKHVLSWLDTFTGRYLQHGIIAVSKGLQAPLAQRFGTDKVVVIENGIDIDAVQAAVQPVDFRLNAPHAKHIGIVGRLQPVKRVDLFLKTAAELRRIEPQTNWQFHIIGDGPLRNELEQLAHDLKLYEHVTFHGHRNDIASCLAGLDALIMCSDHEGMPMTLLEALAVGTLVLAHAVGGLQQVLADGAGGMLVIAHTPAGYADGLVQLLQQNHLSPLKQRGLARLHQYYSAEINGKRIDELYCRRSPLERYLVKVTK